MPILGQRGHGLGSLFNGIGAEKRHIGPREPLCSLPRVSVIAVRTGAYGFSKSTCATECHLYPWQRKVPLQQRLEHLNFAHWPIAAVALTLLS